MKKLVNYRPAVFATLSVTAGILTAYFCLTENVAGGSRCRNAFDNRLFGLNRIWRER